MKKSLCNYGIPEDLATPFFVMDGNVLTKELSKINKAAETFWPNIITAYSVKTNSLPFLASYLRNEDVYAEVVSQDEYEMVSLCGYTPDRIVCNGPVKSQELVTSLMDNCTIINLDSHRELVYAIHHATANPHKNFSIGLRVNIDIEKYFPSESKAGEQGSRFGFCVDNEELSIAINLVRTCPNLSINGLHLHVSTSTRRVEVYSMLSRVFGTIVKQYNLTEISYFDIGGGFFGGLPDKPQWNDYLSVISKELLSNGFNASKLTLIIEPGVSLLAGSFSYYASVVDVKSTNRSRFVVTDGSRIHIDPFFHKNSYYYHHYKQNGSSTQMRPKQIVVGFTCLEYDNIMTLENSEEFFVNDVIRFDKLGAYTLSLSPQFIFFSPAVYFRGLDGKFLCVRRKMTADDFIQTSQFNI